MKGILYFDNLTPYSFHHSTFLTSIFSFDLYFH